MYTERLLMQDTPPSCTTVSLKAAAALHCTFHDAGKAPVDVPYSRFPFGRFQFPAVTLFTLMQELLRACWVLQSCPSSRASSPAACHCMGRYAHAGSSAISCQTRSIITACMGSNASSVHDLDVLVGSIWKF